LINWFTCLNFKSPLKKVNIILQKLITHTCFHNRTITYNQIPIHNFKITWFGRFHWNKMGITKTQKMSQKWAIHLCILCTTLPQTSFPFLYRLFQNPILHQFLQVYPPTNLLNPNQQSSFPETIFMCLPSSFLLMWDGKKELQ